jgi:predicted metal-dependent RNase
MDLQFIQFQDALPITGADEIPDLVPRSLEITGIDFRNAVEVLINEATSPSFVIAAKTKILAEVPDSEKGYVIRNVSVLSADFTATVQSRIRFRLGQDPKKAIGLRAMMQTFLKVLFTTTGSDAFATRIGGSGLKNIGRNFDIGQSSTIVSDFSISVRRTEQQVKALQSKQPRLPDDEKLASAKLLNAKFDVNLTALIARVELIAQSGKLAYANLEL